MKKGLLLLALIALSPPAAAQGLLSIVIDDIGYSAEHGRRAIELPGDFTLAVLPFAPHAAALAEQGHARGKEIMLHIPMTNTANQPLDAGALQGDMDRDTFLTVLREGLSRIPHVRGVNNHMGSQLTQEKRPMRWLMTELSERGLYFVDSRTSALTLAAHEAESAGLAHFSRNVFLDNQREPEHIRQQLRLAMDTARREGRALAIAHPYPETLELLASLQDELHGAGVRLVSVSQLLAPEPAYCPAPPPMLRQRY